MGRYTDKVESYRNKGVIKPLAPACLQQVLTEKRSLKIL